MTPATPDNVLIIPCLETYSWLKTTLAFNCDKVHSLADMMLLARVLLFHTIGGFSLVVNFLTVLGIVIYEIGACRKNRRRPRPVLNSPKGGRHVSV